LTIVIDLPRIERQYCSIVHNQKSNIMGLLKQFSKSKKACKVTFLFPKEAANGAKKVEILGDFNKWERDHAIPMKMDNGGFKAIVELDPGRDYEFRYLIDQQTWENDPAADRYNPSPFGVENSVVVIPDKTEK